MKRFLSLILLMLSIALFAQSDIVAVVNGKNITMDEWNREANIQKLLIELKTSNDTFYQILTTTQEGLVVLEKYKLKILDIYIRKLLFIQFSESMKVAPKDDEVKADVDKEVKNMLSDLKMTEDELNEYLIQLGMGSLNDYKERLYFQRRYTLALANVYTEYLKNVKITDDEMKAYYDKNKSKYTIPTQYDLTVFKVKDKSIADSVRLDLSKGASVEDVAKRYNLSGYINGLVNQNDTSKIPQSIWVYVTNAPRGALLPVQQVSGEWYVVKVKDIKIGMTKTFDEVKEDIRKEILSQKQANINDLIAKDFDNFVKNSKIEIKYKSTIVK
ncbi:MAG TPA: peptidyl-prolyl cis-trans isomerase [Fervidobacterium sp.]|nr:peptidyl-prolyl cis-trans isomerase [Fervidobacterium sp.]HPT53615.1 peptidyl-prolyl cis-trans isomerase [Fervidobacterium sp.]HPZ17275.1 peptidyl-prolyl cis-trans isomerase [Fervidobacterium sp.]HQE48099.1 peptidyl-prolyl cis-trans isomerase [Fervidobacterium sp.]HUM41739.1 peptidyl-prolyl cis-trans isomerase [Fervidobacterium sp.]